MESKKRVCPDCEAEADVSLDRREFIKTVGAGAVGAAGVSLPVWATPRAEAAPTPQSAAETAVSALYKTLTDDQRRRICFDWDYRETTGQRPRGLLRTHVSNNWQITPHHISSSFYTQEQRGIIHDVFRGLVNPERYARIIRH